MNRGLSLVAEAYSGGAGGRRTGTRTALGVGDSSGEALLFGIGPRLLVGGPRSLYRLTGDLTSADVQPQAEQQLSDVAQAQGIPDVAQQLAMARVRATLRRLGFSTVAVSVSGT